jgi:hypothetical protein
MLTTEDICVLGRTKIACPCGCGAAALDPRFVKALRELAALALPHQIEIVLAVRCDSFNRGKKGLPKRAHMEGRAADIRIDGLTVAEMYQLALKVEAFAVGGIGLNDDGTMHLDTRVYPARWSRVRGAYLGLTAAQHQQMTEENPECS